MLERTKPYILLWSEAALPRLVPNHASHNDVTNIFHRYLKGYIGEKKVDYHINFLRKKFTILRGITLKNKDRTFQIDTLILSNYAIFPLEIKNFANQITFDTDLNQFIRNDGESETGYRHPISQAEAQRMNLIQWLDEHSIHSIPIHYFVVIANPETVIKITGDGEAKKRITKIVSHGEHIPQKILTLEKHFESQLYRKINHVQLGKLIVKNAHTKYTDYCNRLNIKFKDIKPGVKCLACSEIGMVRYREKWLCQKCRYTSRTAHIPTIREFLIIFGRGISNRECRYFLQVDNRYIVTRILQSANLIYSKKYKRWFAKDIPYFLDRL